MQKIKRSVVLIIIFVFFTACSKDVHLSEGSGTVALGEEESLAFANEKLHFPKGIEEANLFQEALGNSSSRVPGPTDYMIFGTIVLSSDVIDKYTKEFTWHSWDNEMRLQYEDMMRRSGEDPSLPWKYSEDFVNKVIPAYYYGTAFVCGNRVWIATA